jgi:hypothetical protein
MGHKIFKISFYIFTTIIVLLLLLDRFQVLISFDGADLKGFMQILIVASYIVSLVIFLLVNRLKKENIELNILRGFLIIIMIVMIIFITNDGLSHGRCNSNAIAVKGIPPIPNAAVAHPCQQPK